MYRDKIYSSSHELSKKQKKIKIGPLVAEKQNISWGNMAAIFNEKWFFGRGQAVK